MHLTCGSLRDLQAFFWLRVFPTSQALSTPTHTQVTQAVVDVEYWVVVEEYDNVIDFSELKRGCSDPLGGATSGGTPEEISLDGYRGISQISYSNQDNNFKIYSRCFVVGDKFIYSVGISIPSFVFVSDSEEDNFINSFLDSFEITK